MLYTKDSLFKLSETGQSQQLSILIIRCDIKLGLDWNTAQSMYVIHGAQFLIFPVEDMSSPGEDNTYLSSPREDGQNLSSAREDKQNFVPA